MGENLNSAKKDLATSGITPQILGIPTSLIIKDIIPLSLQNAKKLFPKESRIFKKDGSLRPKDGYFWQYNKTIRFKNLDPEFLEYKNGKVVIDRITGLSKTINYLSGGKLHLYELPSDTDANESTKGFLWFTEGEKKKQLLTFLCQMRLQYQEKFRASYLSTDYKYGVFGGSGVFGFISTPEWKKLRVNGKPIIVAFDSDWETNTDIALAELKLVGALIARGASLKKIKSLRWSSKEGKGIDDYLLQVYNQAMGEMNAFKINGSEGWEPCIDSHPMLNALNRLVKMAIHPFQKYEMMGLDFICQALTSVYRQGKTFKTSQQEEIITHLKATIFSKSRLSVIRATFQDSLQKVQAENVAKGESFLMTEQRNGERFAEENKHKLRWNATKKQWMLWTGKIWEIDDDETSYRLAQRTLRGIQSEVPLLDISNEQRKSLIKIAFTDCEKYGHIENMLKVGRKGTAGMVVLETTFDKNPYILNCQNGMLHLDKLSKAEGGFAWHAPEAYCSQIINYSYEPAAQCPEWIKFLNMIFDNIHCITNEFLAELRFAGIHEDIIGEFTEYQKENIEYVPEEFEAILDSIVNDVITSKNLLGSIGTDNKLEVQQQQWKALCRNRCRNRQPVIDFIQQCIGISMSGFSDEKVLLFCYGPGEGNNGKSTFFNVLERIIGDYFHRINIESLLYTRTGNQNNDEVADMKGKRMVVTSEVSQGALNVSLVKTLTGAEGKIRVKRIYEHPVSFVPSHTLWTFGNQMPTVHVVHDPIWNRIKVIRFTVSIPDILPKKDLLPMDKAVEKLCREASGILNWGLRGWLHYRKHGLLSPREIELESLRYKSEQDKVGLYFNERCILSTKEDPKPGLKMLRGQLYEDYISWCSENHEKPMGKIKFYRDVENRGQSVQTCGGNEHYFNGIGLVSEMEETADKPFGYND